MIITITDNSSVNNTMLSINSFIKHNDWFDGRVTIFTYGELSSYNIDKLKSTHFDVSILIIPEEYLSTPELYAFKITNTGFLLFSNKTIFTNSVINIFEYNKVLTYNPNAFKVNIDSVNLDFIYIPTSAISSDFIERVYLFSKIFKKSDKVLNKVLSYFNIDIHSYDAVIKASDYPDRLFREYINISKRIYAIIFDKCDSCNRMLSLWSSIFTKYKENPIIAKPHIETKEKHRISIIIPAFRADLFIKDTLDSIIDQINIKNVKYEILVGIDNCIPTLNTLNRIRENYPNLRIFKSNKNVGPYVIKNSLVNISKYENILFFDADDIMKVNMISSILSVYSGSGAVRMKFYNYKHGDNHKIKNHIYHQTADGSFFIAKKSFDMIGGFKPFCCGADTEFKIRCSHNGVNTKFINTPIFYRRKHSNNLTIAKKTNPRSALRLDVVNYIENNKDWSIPIDRVTTKITEVI